MALACQLQNTRSWPLAYLCVCETCEELVVGRGRFAGAKRKVFNERWPYLSRIQSSISMKSKVLVAQLCPTLCDPMDCSPSGSSVHEILQARILEWVAIPFSRKSS